MIVEEIHVMGSIEERDEFREYWLCSRVVKREDGAGIGMK